MSLCSGSVNSLGYKSLGHYCLQDKINNTGFLQEQLISRQLQTLGNINFPSIEKQQHGIVIP